MSSRKLAEALTGAQRLLEICQTTPSLNAYRRIATIAVEMCASATPSTRKKVYALAAHAVKRTDTLIKNEADIPMSAECKKGSDKFESILEHIHQHIESVPERNTKFPKFGPSLRFLREWTPPPAGLTRGGWDPISYWRSQA
ncbi:hypothetical protein K438DRAFT_2015505 [Mycena galopus ATCC 62051]|nr:hypothetical protein K438DRAFT_2015505 [Mycena galopus ATCC 62051]